MRWIKRLLTFSGLLIAAGCGDVGSHLPFPTPAQHDLVVLTRPGLMTYTTDENGNPAGLEYDLTQAFAQELGVGVKYIVAEPEELEARLGSTLPPGRRLAVAGERATIRRRRPFSRPAISWSSTKPRCR
jgi:membrane-bound lytic murein transglycosylase F